MPELQPYRGIYSRPSDAPGGQVAQSRPPAWLANLSRQTSGGSRGYVMIGVILAWWLLSFCLMAAAWVMAGPLLSLVADVEAGKIGGPLASSCLCFCFPVTVVGTIAIIFGWPRVGDRIVGRRLGKPVVWASADQLRRGDPLDITYKQEVNSPVEIQSVSISLILRETVTYTSGTQRVTRTFDYVVGQVESPGRSMQKGHQLDERASLDIPPDAIHTFVKRYNKLQWFVAVKVDLVKWPNFNELYEVFVLPQA
jgi:hypothetical protein